LKKTEVSEVGHMEPASISEALLVTLKTIR